MKTPSTTIIKFKQWKMEQFYKAVSKIIMKHFEKFKSKNI